MKNAEQEHVMPMLDPNLLKLRKEMDRIDGIEKVKAGVWVHGSVIKNPE